MPTKALVIGIRNIQIFNYMTQIDRLHFEDEIDRTALRLNKQPEVELILSKRPELWTDEDQEAILDRLGIDAKYILESNMFVNMNGNLQLLIKIVNKDNIKTFQF